MGMTRKGISFFDPNYVFLDRFEESSTVIDVGCGSEAEFSLFMIHKYGLNAYGVDPTRKHAPSLKKLEEQTGGKFQHLPLAVSVENGSIMFHESSDNESGSLLLEHINIQNDETRSYEVESVSPKELLSRLGLSRVEFIKLDLEGAEYELLQGLKKEDLEPFRQIFIEFHHHCTGYTEKDTRKRVKQLAHMGFKVFSLDLHNYLFYKP